MQDSATLQAPDNRPLVPGASSDLLAVSTLVGFASTEGPVDNATDEGAKKVQPKRKQPTKSKRLRSKLLDGDLPRDVTPKGAIRLDPAKKPDTRVRPPKAATSLLEDQTWRHIRLPDAESACEGEDIIVLWAHYTHPAEMPMDKVRTYLNFNISRYQPDQPELENALKLLTSSAQLEVFLKTRLSGDTTKEQEDSRKRRKVEPKTANLPESPAWKETVKTPNMLGRCIVVAYLTGELKAQGTAVTPLLPNEVAAAIAAGKMPPTSAISSNPKLRFSHLRTRMKTLMSYGEQAFTSLEYALGNVAYLDRISNKIVKPRAEDTAAIARKILENGVPDGPSPTCVMDGYDSDEGDANALLEEAYYDSDDEKADADGGRLGGDGSIEQQQVVVAPHIKQEEHKDHQENGHAVQPVVTVAAHLPFNSSKLSTMSNFNMQVSDVPQRMDTADPHYDNNTEAIPETDTEDGVHVEEDEALEIHEQRFSVESQEPGKPLRGVVFHPPTNKPPQSPWEIGFTSTGVDNPPFASTSDPTGGLLPLPDAAAKELSDIEPIIVPFVKSSRMTSSAHGGVHSNRNKDDASSEDGDDDDKPSRMTAPADGALHSSISPNNTAKLVAQVQESLHQLISFSIKGRVPDQGTDLAVAASLEGYQPPAAAAAPLPAVPSRDPRNNINNTSSLLASVVSQASTFNFAPQTEEGMKLAALMSQVRQAAVQTTGAEQQQQYNEQQYNAGMDHAAQHYFNQEDGGGMIQEKKPRRASAMLHDIDETYEEQLSQDPSWNPGGSAPQGPRSPSPSVTSAQPSYQHASRSVSPPAPASRRHARKNHAPQSTLPSDSLLNVLAAAAATTAATSTRPQRGNRGKAGYRRGGVDADGDVYYSSWGGTSDRVGRPPSYDDKVLWCVGMKRALWQNYKVLLTLQEAVMLANNLMPDAEGKLLVPSTLRKRVLASCKMTWSKVSTDTDAFRDNPIRDADVINRMPRAVTLLRHFGVTLPENAVGEEELNQAAQQQQVNGGGEALAEAPMHELQQPQYAPAALDESNSGNDDDEMPAAYDWAAHAQQQQQQQDGATVQENGGELTGVSTLSLQHILNAANQSVPMIESTAVQNTEQLLAAAAAECAAGAQNQQQQYMQYEQAAVLQPAAVQYKEEEQEAVDPPARENMVEQQEQQQADASPPQEEKPLVVGEHVPSSNNGAVLQAFNAASVEDEDEMMDAILALQHLPGMSKKEAGELSALFWQERSLEQKKKTFLFLKKRLDDPEIVVGIVKRFLTAGHI